MKFKNSLSSLHKDVSSLKFLHKLVIALTPLSGAFPGAVLPLLVIDLPSLKST